MNGVRKIERLDPDGQVFVSLAEEVDLDDLLLHLLAEGHGEPYLAFPGGPDMPTALSDQDWMDPEVIVGRFRKVPCGCGDDHTYDVWPVDDDENPRGSYLGVMTR
ncbi:hypothetical protein [Oerskovia paurometabola]|uniref:hypothetical protein n=1 Tax=Oerskovia paurometabola TaxID=162170 RepID=UPI00343471B4